ncbi:MAG: hypothetical protein KZQ96_20790 [Candidatus Thiodiazotropha sp. (ex Lucinoma borealis)]|nr:hypothetical protein [Candidatus Thiodiazotropha sp. (ex Lucinoma borealis)]
MRKLREVLRLRLSAQLSIRQIRDSLRLSLGAVQKIASKADKLGLDWESIEKLDDGQLAHAIYPESDTRTSSTLQLPDWPDAFKELHFKNVTKHLIWEEYAEQYPNRSYSYPQYCYLFGQW